MLVIAGGTPTSDIEDVRSIDSGHADLMRGGLALAGVVDDEDARDQGDFGRPIAGYGSGSFGRAFFEHVEQARTTVSHSEPITVAAEQGAIGFVVYVALLVAALVDPARRPAGTLADRASWPPPASSRSVSTASGTRASSSTRRSGRCSASGSRARGDPPEDSATI